MGFNDNVNLIQGDKILKASKETNDLLRELIAEQKRSNELLTYLAERAHAQASAR